MYRLSLIVALVFLSGCTLHQKGLQTIAPDQLQRTNEAVKNDGPITLATGQMIKVTNTALPDGITVEVGKPYVSALGEDCFQLFHEEKSLARGVLSLCRNTDNSWSLAPLIWPNSNFLSNSP